MGSDSPNPLRKISRSEGSIVIWILTAGLIHSLIYTFLMPPWQHYDEPTQFEYIWLIARRSEFPVIGDFDIRIRREIAASMVEFDFFKDLNIKPNLLLENKPAWIGISQLEDPPFYYLIAGIPLRPFLGMSVTSQLYTVRFTSVFMYLGTVLVSYGFVREFTEGGHLLRILVPALLVLNPAFTELMTAVNNDVGATFFFSLYLIVGLRILLRGLDLRKLIALLVLTGICVFIKSTIWTAVPLTLLLLYFQLHKTLKLPGTISWAIFIVPFILLCISVLNNKDAAYWYREDNQTQTIAQSRVVHPDSPLGDTALQFLISPLDEKSTILFQPLSNTVVNRIQGKTITLGYWVWASDPTEITLPYLWIDGKSEPRKEWVGTQPEFRTFAYHIGPKAEGTQFVINPEPVQVETPTSIYFDGIILAAGDFTGASPPVFSDMTGRNGVWGAQEFENLIRNPSADNTWLTIHPQLSELIRSSNPINPNQILSTMQDLETTGWVYQGTLINLFKSFWATFGWNHIHLTRPWYLMASGITVIGLLGAAFAGLRGQWRNPTDWTFPVVWIFFAGLIIWLQALARPGFPFLGKNLFIPTARYAFPAIIPTMALLGMGWHFWLKDKAIKILASTLLFAILFALDVQSIITIYQTYYGG